MTAPIEWRHTEFARVISCTRCTLATDPYLLRDDGENVPQPGYIGSRYKTSRVLLVGRNPGKTKALVAPDRAYTAALRTLRDDPTPARYKELTAILREFIPKWQVHKYFPLEESGLALEDIAYCNIVRCRTSGNAEPCELLAQQCVQDHFKRWLTLLAPKIVVFVNKAAWTQGYRFVEAKGLPCPFMNGKRSLSHTGRVANREAVVALIRQYRG